MASRLHPFVTDFAYHIFNRGVAKQPIFTSQREYKHFILTLQFYMYGNTTIRLSRFLEYALEERNNYFRTLKENSKPLIEIFAYSLLPNHYHLLVRQKVDGGIQKYMSLVGNSYAKYRNTRSKRVGPLWQGPYNDVYVETEDQFLHLSRYIHLNPFVSGVVTLNDLWKYPYSSLPTYLHDFHENFVNTDEILSFFHNNPDKYRDFLKDHAWYAKELTEIKHLLLE